MPLAAVDILEAALADWNIVLTDEQHVRFETYARLLVDWNTHRMNLTRLTSENDIAIGHFLDSLAITQVCRIPNKAKLLDVGSGAGFPGLAIKIMRPDLHVTLLEATAKKLLFCREIIETCSLSDVETIHGRAEETGETRKNRGMFDVITARAVAPMSTLIPWTAGYLAPNGVLVAWKGPAAQEEMESARDVVRQMRIRWRIVPVTLPLSGEPPRVHQYVLCQREV